MIVVARQILLRGAGELGNVCTDIHTHRCREMLALILKGAGEFVSS